MALEGAIDVAKECARLTDERTRLARQLATLTGKLGNAGFLAKAPPAVVDGERQKATEWTAKLAALTDKLGALGGA